MLSFGREDPGLMASLHECADRADRIAASSWKLGLSAYDYFISRVNHRWHLFEAHHHEADQLLQRLCRGWLAGRQRSDGDPQGITKDILTAIDHGVASGASQSLAFAFASGLDQTNFRAVEAGLIKRFNQSQGIDRQFWGHALRSFYAGRGEPDLYINFVRKTGVHREDCGKIAALMLKVSRTSEALEWVERGLTVPLPDGTDLDSVTLLPILRREILAMLGREEECLDSAWEDYLARICHPYFLEVIRYAPEARRAKWREHALAEAELRAADGGLQVLCAEKELMRLAALAARIANGGFEQFESDLLSEAGQLVAFAHPAAAAEFYRASALALLARGVSVLGEAAIWRLESARGCYLNANLRPRWNACVEDIRERYGSKKGFMKKFEGMAKGYRQ